MTMISHIAVGASGDDRSKQLLQGLPSRVVSEHSRHSPRHVSLRSGFECLWPFYSVLPLLGQRSMVPLGAIFGWQEHGDSWAIRFPNHYLLSEEQCFGATR